MAVRPDMPVYRPPTTPGNPKIVGRYKARPKVGPGLIVKKRGGGLGYVTIRKPPAPGATPGGPKPPAGPYDSYKDTAPWAIPLLEQIDRDQAAHQAYVSDKVMPWLSTGLANLTGINPSAPGYNPTIQQQYLANVQGQVGGAYNAVAAATPMTPSATTPGALMAAPNAYLGQAMREAAVARSSAAMQSAQAQSALNTVQPNILAQGAMMRLSDYAKGLPALYADRRAQQRAKIDQWIADQEKAAEAERHNRVMESISAQNASTNAALGLGRLGIDQTKLAGSPAPDPSTIPTGYVSSPDGKGGWKVVRDPTYANPSGGGGGGTATRDGQGRLRVPKLRDDGWTRLPDRYVKNGNPQVNRKAFKVTQGADGNWWIIKKSGSGGSAKAPKVSAGKPPQTVYERLVKATDNNLISDQQNIGTPDLLRFLRPMQPSKPGPAWQSWFNEVLSALARVDPKYRDWIAGWVKRRIKDGTWKGTF